MTSTPVTPDADADMTLTPAASAGLGRQTPSASLDASAPAADMTPFDCQYADARRRHRRRRQATSDSSAERQALYFPTSRPPGRRYQTPGLDADAERRR
jgi:hypothetical protein